MLPDHEGQIIAGAGDSPVQPPASRRSLVISSIAILCLVALASVTTFGYAMYRTSIEHGVDTPAMKAATATSKPVSTTVTPTPGNQPMTMARWNAIQGCSNGPHKPLPGLVDSGTNPYMSGLAPREVALTFDDGPTSYDTPRILSFLEQTHTPATFFVEGQYSLYWADLLKREWNDGFAIGMHSWNHPDFTTLTAAQMRDQLSSTLNQVHHVLGSQACLWFWRPPYGSVNTTVLQEAQSFGLTTITWDDAGLDWTLPGAHQIAVNVRKYVHPGAIILLHDGPQDRDQTLAALPMILTMLSELHLKLVTIPQLLLDNGYLR